MDTLIVGAGFAGAVAARALADAGETVCVVDRRAHAGGLAWDRVDDAGLRVHAYGAHVFHTDDEALFGWLGRFTAWQPCTPRELAVPDARTGVGYPFPLNRTAINRLYRVELDTVGVAALLERMCGCSAPAGPASDAEALLFGRVGRDLCERFYRGAARKRFGTELAALDASALGDVAVRPDDDDRAFADRFQALPADGYAALFARLLEHPRIELRLGTEFAAVDAALDRRRTVFSGAIDEYYGRRFGALPWTRLRFEHEHRPGCARAQPVAHVSYPNDHPHLRVSEFKHLTGEVHAGTSLVRELPAADGEPAWPQRTTALLPVLARYEALAAAERAVFFVGRLGRWRALSMAEAAADALALARRLTVRTTALAA